MKIIAVTGQESVLVEMSVGEMRSLTDFKWHPDPSHSASWRIELQRFKPGQEVEITKTVEYAKDLIDTFRNVIPGLRQQAQRLNKLANEIQIHEPDHTLLPKESA